MDNHFKHFMPLEAAQLPELPAPERFAAARLGMGYIISRRPEGLTGFLPIFETTKAMADALPSAAYAKYLGVGFALAFVLFTDPEQMPKTVIGFTVCFDSLANLRKVYPREEFFTSTLKSVAQASLPAAHPNTGDVLGKLIDRSGFDGN